MEFYTECKLKEFREIEEDYFDNGKRYTGTKISDTSSELMLQLINKLEAEVKRLEKEKAALSQRISVSSLAKGEPYEMQKLQWKNKAIEDALKYLVETKERKDTIGQDSIYIQRKKLGWMKARNLLRSLEDER